MHVRPVSQLSTPCKTSLPFHWKNSWPLPRLNRLADTVSRLNSHASIRDRHGMTGGRNGGCWRRSPLWPDDRGRRSGEHVAPWHNTKVRPLRCGPLRGAALAVARDRAREDRRTEHLDLTRAGMEVYRELVPLARDFENELLKLLAGPDAEHLLKGLAALEEVLLKKRDPS